MPGSDGDGSSRPTLRERLARFIAGVPDEPPAAVANPSPAPTAIRLRLKEFETAMVRDVMTSRVDMAAVEAASTLHDVLNLFAEEAHSRMPVYRDSLDDPLGFVHIKDVVAELVRLGWTEETLKSQPLERLSRDIMFVPGSTLLPDLMVQMQASRTHIALVVDEYGGTAGMVCLEDLVEQIVGDIEDEHDEAKPMIVRRGRYAWDIDGLALIPDVERETALPLNVADFETEVETIGGLASALAGQLPQVGDSIPHPSGSTIEVLSADPRRVIRVRLKAPKPSAPPPLAQDKTGAIDRS
ncbi:MAG TPA: CBS domain-containing protein [Hyphomonadaceae bacterium]|nr:CBS domain-containing protein [Hyphomonadaceae bacterium]